MKPSHKTNQFAYLMQTILEWTDFISGRNSFNMTKIAALSPDKGNFHSYNHKVIYTTIIKNSQGGYKYKMGVRCFTLKRNNDYTLCIEILNVNECKLRISIDKATSKGLTIGNVAVKKFSHGYVNSRNSVEFMYFYRVIVNFMTTTSDPLYQLHLLADIPQDGTDLQTYAQIMHNRSGI